MLTGQILLQLFILVLVVQLFGGLGRRFLGQQMVIGEILAGLALGPSLLGAVWPGIQQQLFPPASLPTLQTLGDLGLVLYIFSLGAHLDIHLMVKQSSKAVITSLSSILLPLLMGGALAFFLYAKYAGVEATPLSFTLMVGISLAITAFPVLARLLTEKQMIDTSIGILALTCAAIGDVIAWCFLALITALITAHSLLSAFLIPGLVILFAGVMFTCVRPLLVWLDRGKYLGKSLPILVIALLLFSAYLTNAIGVHPVFGAFIVGLILPRRITFVALTRNIDQINSMLFLPLFFVYSGLNTQIGLINTPFLWFICALILGIACLGKMGGGAVSLRCLGGSWNESLTLGVLLNTKGLVEIVILNIGLSLKVLSPTLFAILVIVALLTTMMAAPLLSLLGYKNQQQDAAEQRTEDEISSHEFSL